MIDIDLFSMKKRVLHRLEKYVFDRVWNEPYSEYRTNTRPRILNRTSEASLGVDADGHERIGLIYLPMSGVLSGEFEQVDLPSSSAFYVYSVELEQFRSVKVLAQSWIMLAEYCNQHHVDYRVYSSSGVLLWRGGIYIKQDPTASSILVAVDAAMLHRCLDLTRTSETGDRVIVQAADPSDIFFTKYVDTDLTDVEMKRVEGETTTEEVVGSYRKLAPADNVITCVKMGIDEISALRRGEDPIPGEHSVAFINGHVVSGDHKKFLLMGDYVESVYDKDILHDGNINRLNGPIYSTASGDRILIHMPRRKNEGGYMITPNTCDFYLIPQELTDDQKDAGYSIEKAGVLVHQCERASMFHQLTYCDFSINTDDLDNIARESGFATTPDGVPKYYLHFVIRSMSKKKRLVRDANYGDLLYTYTHKDEDIVQFLLTRAADAPFGLEFWTAEYLEQHTQYTDAMQRRVGPSIPPQDPDHLKRYYRPTTDRVYQAGKQYFTVSPTGYYIPTESREGTAIPEGLMEYIFDGENPKSISPEAGQRIIDDEKVRDKDIQSLVTACHGIPITKENQCKYCQLRLDCPLYKASGDMKLYVCSDFIYRNIKDYIKIFGYYNTLSLICKRVTTYRVMGLRRDIIGLQTGDEQEERVKETVTIADRDWKWIHPIDLEPGTETESTAVYSDVSRVVPVHIPLALFDLKASEWYPMVYINGVKVEDDLVEIPDFTDQEPKDLEEIHWTFTPSFDEEILWETEKKYLSVTLKPGAPMLRPGDYVAVELIPKPEGEDAIDTASALFDLAETEDDVKNGKLAFEPLGSNLKMTSGKAFKRKNSELLYLNGKQLVNGIDYLEFAAYPSDTLTPSIQNVGYLQESNNVLEAVLTTDKVIGTAKGFVLGNKIRWDGVSPFWFDNLSILSVEGKVISDFTFDYSGLYLGDEYGNGAPFMVRTNVPQKVLELISDPEDETADIAKLVSLRNYFDTLSETRPYRALIPYEHKIYSTYLLSLVGDYLKGEVDFEIYDENHQILSKEQFLEVNADALSHYKDLKKYDIVYPEEHPEYPGIATEDLKFADIYPIYHNLHVRSNLVKRTVAYLMDTLLPADYIRHREHVNGK